MGFRSTHGKENRGYLRLSPSLMNGSEARSALPFVIPRVPACRGACPCNFDSSYAPLSITRVRLHQGKLHQVYRRHEA